MTRVLAVLVFAFALLPGAGRSQTRGPETLVDAFVRTWNAHDIRSLVESFTKDADFVNVVGARMGPDQLRAELEQVHGTFFKSSIIRSTGVTTRMLRPDVALVHFTWELDGQVDFEGKPVGRRHGIITIVAVREGETWKITALQNTNKPQPAKTAG